MKNFPIPHIFRNFYFIAGIAFVVFVLFFDTNDIFTQVSQSRKNKILKEEKSYYEEQIEIVNKERNELQSDTQEIERFAREKYYMKKEGEDIFVIKEDESIE